MMHKEQQTYYPVPDYQTWLLWIGLTTLGGAVGSTFILVNSPLFGYFTFPVYLTVALFLVSLGQRFLLRRFVARSGLWVLATVSGIVFGCVLFFAYILPATYAYQRIIGNQVLFAICIYIVEALCFGGLIGCLQGVLIIRKYGTKRGRILWWVGVNVLAWVASLPVSEYFINILLSQGWSRGWSFLVVFGIWFVETVAWFVYGVLTGTVFVWLGERRELASTVAP